VKVRSVSGRIIRSAVGSNRTLRAVLSTGEIARDGHTVDPRGWILPPSKSVPLVDSHRDGDGIRTVLGKVSEISVGSTDLDSGRSVSALIGYLNFADADVNPDAEVAYQLYRAGYADSVSVSFIPREYDYANQRGRAPGALDISAAELLEVSVVAVPSDVNAKVLGRALRAQSAGRSLTRTHREVLARFHAERIRREDAAAPRYQTLEERLARAKALARGDR